MVRSVHVVRDAYELVGLLLFLSLVKSSWCEMWIVGQTFLSIRRVMAAPGGLTSAFSSVRAATVTSKDLKGCLIPEVGMARGKPALAGL